MKLTHIRNTLLSILTVLLLVSCGDNKPTGSKNEKPGKSATVTSSAGSEKFLYISDKSNIQIAEIIIAKDGTNINLKGQTFFGEKKGDKLKYYDQQNNMRYEIKYKDGGFKLRDSNSELLWKIKVYDAKIKLANNEEMNRPVEIKVKSEKKLTTYKDGVESKVVRIDPTKTPLNINNTFYTRGFENNYHSAILLLDELNDLEKYMIIAELNR